MSAEDPFRFDPAKEKVLAILPVLSGFLSLCCSTWIVVEVMTTKAKRSTVYNRLLLGMSIADVMTSIGYMFSTFPMPTSVEELPWTFGTATTCTVQGFFVQLGIVPPVCKYDTAATFFFRCCKEGLF